MFIALVAIACVVLLVLAFLVPKLSRHAQRGVNKPLSAGARAGGKAPGRLGKWASKPFSSSLRATNKSASAGRRGRKKMPL